MVLLVRILTTPHTVAEEFDLPEQKQRQKRTQLRQRRKQKQQQHHLTGAKQRNPPRIERETSWFLTSPMMFTSQSPSTPALVQVNTTGAHSQSLFQSVPKLKLKNQHVNFASKRATTFRHGESHGFNNHPKHVMRELVLRQTIAHFHSRGCSQQQPHDEPAVVDMVCGTEETSESESGSDTACSDTDTCSDHDDQPPSHDDTVRFDDLAFREAMSDLAESLANSCPSAPTGCKLKTSARPRAGLRIALSAQKSRGLVLTRTMIRPVLTPLTIPAPIRTRSPKRRQRPAFHVKRTRGTSPSEPLSDPSSSSSSDETSSSRCTLPVKIQFHKSALYQRRRRLPNKEEAPNMTAAEKIEAFERKFNLTPIAS